MGGFGTGIRYRGCPGRPAKITNLSAITSVGILSEDAEEPFQRIEVTIYYALFERNDRVLGNRDRFRTHLPATSSDVAVADVV